MAQRESDSIYKRVQRILESARANVARSVNTTQVVANWLVGREIVEEEQKGKRRARYGQRLLEDLSARLTADYGSGFSMQSLRYMRQFYLEYPELLKEPPIRHTVRGKSLRKLAGPPKKIRHTLCGELGQVEKTAFFSRASGEEPWRPG
jgi:hypothetical protein